MRVLYNHASAKSSVICGHWPHMFWEKLKEIVFLSLCSFTRWEIRKHELWSVVAAVCIRERHLEHFWFEKSEVSERCGGRIYLIESGNKRFTRTLLT